MFLSNLVAKSEKEKFILIAFISGTVLIASLLLEHLFNVPVCRLCRYERYPYLLGMAFSLFALCFLYSPKVLLLARTGLVLTFLVSLFLALYHVLIQHNILPVPEFCKVSFPKGASIEELKTFIMNRKNMIPCNKVPMRILFLSLAEWNGFTSFFLLVASWKFKRSKK